jgi:hypothetical protein
VGWHAGNIGTIENNTSGIGVQTTGYQVKQGAFSSTVWSNNS